MEWINKPTGDIEPKDKCQVYFYGDGCSTKGKGQCGLRICADRWCIVNQ